MRYTVFSSAHFKPAARLMATLLLVMTLAACGIKPDKVQPPSGKDASGFPRQYPAAEKPPLHQTPAQDAAPAAAPVTPDAVKRNDTRRQFTFRP